MKNNKDDPRVEFDELLSVEQQLIARMARVGRHSLKRLKELSRIQARRAELGRKLNIGLL